MLRQTFFTWPVAVGRLRVFLRMVLSCRSGAAGVIPESFIRHRLVKTREGWLGGCAVIVSRHSHAPLFRRSPSAESLFR